ncbi:DDE-type integrase/transposase/recombinase [Paenarthrobacter sp. NPDC091669]|uniref:DDE-type integrase/transposase/recombinase n=1 Tax=Paenarthrobacter sp. NPDC091669 TaxID=3364384 RepID=UPI0038285BD9
MSSSGTFPTAAGTAPLAGSKNERTQGFSAARYGHKRTRNHPRNGTAYVHTVLDDYSRIAYAEIHPDEKAVTAIDILQRPWQWFATQWVLSDNGSACVSDVWKAACAELGITPKRPRTYGPQTNN